ncbi:MAG: hypothetical protein IJW59_04800 [Clostridia bacterium]|nr:hypothetical protein [Clostridia bacterium]
MAENIKFKVSYVRITEEGLDRHTDIYLDDISMEEKKDIKSLIFLPIKTEEVVDITNLLKNFPILENLYIPSTMKTSIKELSKECPMLKSLLILTRDAIRDSLDKEVVKVNAHEEEGDNTAEFRTFVDTDKNGKQTFVVNAKQVQNHEIIIVEKKVERLTPSQVTEYISGEKGIMPVIDQINAEIEDERCKIELSSEMLESLLSIFVEKGVTFEEFTIDFSKLYDKIESYKSIAKSVNQVSIKEEIEGLIVETYQNVLRVHYDNLLKDLAPKLLTLANVTVLDTQEMLLRDLKTYIANVIVESPLFDEDYKTSGEIDNILSEIPSGMSRHIRVAKDRGLLRKYLAQAVSELKSNKDELFEKIDRWLKSKTDVMNARNSFARAFGLDVERKQSQKLLDTFVDALVTRNFGTLTKEDVLYVIGQIQSGINNQEISGKELIRLINTEVSSLVTKEDLKNSAVEFIAKNGYFVIETETA